MADRPRVAVLAGGVGAARLLRGVVEITPPDHVTAIVNVGDDEILHGLHISPDLDTITYTLAGAIDPHRGWGLVDETWSAMDSLRRYTAYSGHDELGWFNLGDRDLGTHMYRTARRLGGATLSEVTAEVAATWGLGLHLLPVSDDPIRTRVESAEAGSLTFQEYFVLHHHGVTARAVRFDGAEDAMPAPGVLDAIAAADVVIIAPSNPIVSIAPLLAVPGVRDAVAARRDRCVAVSPIIGGRALKGPADRLLGELDHEISALGVARIYRDLCAAFVLDAVDVALVPSVEELGMAAVATPSIMTDAASAATLVLQCVRSVGVGR